MIAKSTVILIVLTSCYTNACQKPSISAELYPITAERSSYDSGDIYELMCVPGYKPENTHRLICQGSKEWQGTIPDCEKLKTPTRWWILLIVVASIVILIPCTIPRIYFCIYDERHVKRLEFIHSRHGARDCVDGILMESGNGDKMELIEKENKATPLKTMSASNQNVHEISPQPLPQRRHRIDPEQNSHSSNLVDEKDGMTSVFSLRLKENTDPSRTHQREKSNIEDSSPNFFHD